MNETIEKIQPVNVYLNGELIGQADEIITNATGSYYGTEGQYLEDNGDYIPVGGYGVETK